MVEARISANALQVRRGQRLVIDVESLELRRGEVLAVIGPNGAGKTTLLLHLALLERPTSGSLLFDGAPVRGRELPLRRRMAVVFQEPLLLDRSVTDNVEQALALRNVPRAQRRERRERWLARFGITHLAARSSRALSGGEAQRVSLARAFALDPEVLFLDEPFSALDHPTREALLSDLASVLDETGTTTLFITHDHDEAARMGDRVAVLIGGRITQVGPPAEVFASPADEATAAFVGIETMLPAEVVSREGELLTMRAGRHTVEALSHGAFERALVCLRPEDISLSPAGERVASSARNKLPGRVARITPSNAGARVEVDCGVRLVAHLTRRSVEDLRLAPGVPVVASFKATAVHLIPK